MEEIQAQLLLCLKSLTQLLDFLKVLDDMSSLECKPVHTAKCGLIEIAATLSTEIYRSESDPVIGLGSLVLAPRMQCHHITVDFAVVVGCPPLRVSPDAGDEDESSLNEEISYSILWVRPRNVYEFNSTGINMTKSMLSNKAYVRYSDQERMLSNLRQETVVLGKVFGDIWAHCEIVKIDEEAEAVEVRVNSTEKGLLVLDSVDSTVLHASINESLSAIYGPHHWKPASLSDEKPLRVAEQIIRLPFTMRFVAPILGTQNLGIHFQGEDTNYLNEDDSIFNTTISLPRIQLQDKSGLDSSEVSLTRPFDTIVGLGDWERHTKGVASRLMMKMGYKRGAGLGKQCQGIVVPIRGLEKALPAGLSLDYLHEVRNENENGSDAKDVLRKRVLAAVDATSKQRRIAASSDGGEVSSEGQVKSGIGGKKVTVFNFMNNMRTSEAEAAEKEAEQQERLQARRKLEVRRKLQGHGTSMKSLF